ncbi:MAG: GNAT family N-acetyltransferase [Candidatus Marinimicrobia bacterium]|nr:GNAT family N-acetyltransferase [Candidatus Neomarinimicrobiota bacterium]MCF7851316.1 GNAT family N-acetyltransferase [Candidatus Neomarinimicrobiota bacterium]
MKIYLETTRMMFREFTSDDADLLVDLDSDPLVTKYINGGKPTPKKHVVERVIPRLLHYNTRDDGLGLWAALHKTDLEFMGWFHFRPFQPMPEQIELGYRLKRKFWGEGYATEGSEALIQKGFDTLGVTRVVAITDPENIGSRRVMEKVGLRFEGNHVEADGFVCVKYGLERSDYQKKIQTSK